VFFQSRHGGPPWDLGSLFYRRFASQEFGFSRMWKITKGGPGFPIVGVPGTILNRKPLSFRILVTD
jgi:hypothetical protein